MTSSRGCRLALQCCADHGGSWERRGSGVAATRSAAGARRSCARRTCATRSSRSACCRRRSRPRSRGSGCRRSTSACSSAPPAPCGRSAARARSRAASRTCIRTVPPLLHDPRARAARGELEQWAEIKRAASDAVIDCGGTITHHHAVGRDHRPWYDRQRPDSFAAALRGREGARSTRRARSIRGCSSTRCSACAWLRRAGGPRPDRANRSRPRRAGRSRCRCNVRRARCRRRRSARRAALHRRCSRARRGRRIRRPPIRASVSVGRRIAAIRPANQARSSSPATCPFVSL